MDKKRGYLEWHEWAEQQTKKGIKQEQCECGLWLFPSEKKEHECEKKKEQPNE